VGLDCEGGADGLYVDIKTFVCVRCALFLLRTVKLLVSQPTATTPPLKPAIIIVSALGIPANS
jgi:hypothetical protein